MKEKQWNMDRPVERSAPWRPRIYWSIALLLGSALVLVAIMSGTALMPPSSAVAGDADWVEEVERGSLLWEVSAAGALRPANTRVISALVPGSVIEKHREVGDLLEPGTPIATVDNVSERRRLLELTQELKVAEAALSELRRDLTSSELQQQKVRHEMELELRDARRRAEANKALPVGVTPEIEVLRLAERAEALETLLDVENRRAAAVAGSGLARVEQQQARVERLVKLKQFQQQVVDSLSVVSPVRGVLKNLPIENGQWLTEGTVLAEIVEPGELVARLRVPESAAASLRTGLPARLNARGIDLTGRVKRIDPAVSGGTITVDVELESAPDTLRADLSVQGFIELDRLDDVLHMARPVGVAAHSEARLSRITDNGRAEPVTVSFGPSAGDRIQVLRGLDAGDRVVLSTVEDGPQQNSLVSAR
ncbi:MAG: HlyD family efflux transporter periplasmic adaptor subunit [Pseudomonadota bacterium]